MKFLNNLRKWIAGTAKTGEKFHVVRVSVGVFTSLTGLLLAGGIILATVFLIAVSGGVESEDSAYTGGTFTGVYSEHLPIYDEIKGTGLITDEIAQLAVGTAIKYKLLPSVILSQYAYECEWGRSYSAEHDTNFFGITWFEGCGFPQGSTRGIGGSEGGWYMKFPSAEACFSYYGYMVARQSNFNACVGNKNPGECLLILGRGGYAAAGITISSNYYVGCMAIIEANNFTQYDEFAISKWSTFEFSVTGELPEGTGEGLELLNTMMGVPVYNGECYGLTAWYVDQLGGPVLMGSGFMAASDIGSDYNWDMHGWKVKMNPHYSEIRPGDIVNFKRGNGFHILYGHTAICHSVQGESVIVYDQWAGHGCTLSTYSRPIQSIVRKVR
ncbi:hypothetical protein M2139_001489 [Enterococcus sp. PF1-24]|uniref:glucosaminidase domain-containing protein n=1 Tax=unclassified Enterococcus TaxID=2608891 RepID=UPI002473BA57|nr:MULTISPECIES: glucosaminidase domain-containing protein [unclassified Enterococcus]MDH6364520.1 hypothetical protein [Enterococcus sp. PFB1-1]MDH6401603.1 hypothetical protein [Enterococcus sp. PF1-24]